MSEKGREPGPETSGHAGARASKKHTRAERRERRAKGIRAPNASRETIIARHREVRELMRKLEWVKGVTAPELAERWGVAVKTVESIAAVESRNIVADRDEARRDITAGCQALMLSALSKKDGKEFRAVAELYAQVSGAKTPEEHIVTSTNLDATPAEAARLVREAFGEKALPKPNGASNGAANGKNGHSKPNGSGTVPPIASGS